MPLIWNVSTDTDSRADAKFGAIFGALSAGDFVVVYGGDFVVVHEMFVAVSGDKKLCDWYKDEKEIWKSSTWWGKTASADKIKLFWSFGEDICKDI